MCKVLWGCPVIVAQNTTVSDTYRGIGDSIGRYSGILIPGIGGIDRKTVIDNRPPKTRNGCPLCKIPLCTKRTC
jgi:hypothetical protein